MEEEDSRILRRLSDQRDRRWRVTGQILRLGGKMLVDGYSSVVGWQIQKAGSREDSHTRSYEETQVRKYSTSFANMTRARHGTVWTMFQ